VAKLSADQIIYTEKGRVDLVFGFGTKPLGNIVTKAGQAAIILIEC
jgi:hypothetical protein